jgi:hypothetical protein
MKNILAFGMVLALAAPALADSYKANLRSKQTDAHEMRDARGQGGAASARAPTALTTTGYVADYRPTASSSR